MFIRNDDAVAFCVVGPGEGYALPYKLHQRLPTSGQLMTWTFWDPALANLVQNTLLTTHKLDLFGNERTERLLQKPLDNGVAASPFSLTNRTDIHFWRESSIRAGDLFSCYDLFGILLSFTARCWDLNGKKCDSIHLLILMKMRAK